MSKRPTGIYPQTHRLANQTQTYEDGTPVRLGDKLRYQQAGGGILPPGPPREGEAAYFPGAGNPGTLYGKWTTEKGEDRYFYIDSGTLIKIEEFTPDPGFRSI